MAQALHPGPGLWLFAYGSLMWDGAVPASETRPATLHGYHRRYCLWDERERGTPGHPSLTLGLVPGHSCAGLAMHLSEPSLPGAFWTAWRHEMPAGFYDARMVPIETESGSIEALTFIARPDHQLFAPDLDDATIAHHLAHDSGPGGTAREYFDRTTACLIELGTPDPYLARLTKAL